MSDVQQLVTALNKLRDKSSEVTVNRYPSESEAFVKVFGCDSDGRMLYHIEVSEEDWNKVHDFDEKIR